MPTSRFVLTDGVVITGVEQFDVDVHGLRSLARWIAVSGLHSASLKSCNLGAGALRQLATPLATSSLTNLDLSNNYLVSGTTDKAIDIEGFSQVCRAVGASQIKHWDISGMRGVASSQSAHWPMLLASLVSWKTCRLQVLTLDSTGVDGAPKVYVLDTNLDTLSLEGCHLGPVDLRVLSAWLTILMVREALSAIDLSDNPLTGGAHNDAGSVTVGSDVTGVRHLFTALAQCDAIADLTMINCGLGSAASAAFGDAFRPEQPSTTRVPPSITMDQNPLSGSSVSATSSDEMTYDKDLMSFESYLGACGGGVTRLSLAGCHLGPMAMTELGVFIDESKSIQSVKIDGNPLSGSVLDKYGDLAEADLDLSGLELLCSCISSSQLGEHCLTLTSRFAARVLLTFCSRLLSSVDQHAVVPSWKECARSSHAELRRRS